MRTIAPFIVVLLQSTPSLAQTCSAEQAQCDLCGGCTVITGDPHIVFASGGRADFRGKNNTWYALLSAPGVQFSAKTYDTTFLLPRPQLVHGSFFTEAAFAVRGASGQEYVVESDSNVHRFAVTERYTGKKVTEVTKKWNVFHKDGVYALLKDVSLVVRAHGWQVTVTRKSVYNYISGPSRNRYDIKITPITGALVSTFGAPSKTCFPHGLIAQGWDNGPRIDGARDDYTFDKSRPEIVTKAMAEGAIEGVAQDYEIVRNEVEFKFSRYRNRSHDSCKPRQMGFVVETDDVAFEGSAGVEDDDTAR